jgi:2-polyprenyl-6-methoxyphenol hydroxylase-like FAD-dependent oxidoreductase
MHVAIVGGGIGGLSTALYLHQQGIDCRVYESVPEYKPLGVGINLFPHAMRRLFELGLEDAVREVGVEAREFTFFNQHGQLIYREPCGRHAGYDWPHFSFHRADLHRVLLDAVMARLGPDAVHNGQRCSGFSQDDQGVTLQLDAATASHAVRADVVIACDGFHSAVRRQLYPDEVPAHFGGINLWRGVTRGQPFLSGASVTRCGALRHGKLVVYPIRNHPDGTQTINWAVEILKSDWTENDWNKTGQLSDFIEYFFLIAVFPGWISRGCFARPNSFSNTRWSTVIRSRAGRSDGSRCWVMRRIRCIRAAATAVRNPFSMPSCWPACWPIATTRCRRCRPMKPSVGPRRATSC